MTKQIPKSDFPITYSQNNAVIKLPERLTVLEAIAFKETCSQLLQQSSPGQRIIFDFSQTKFIDSSGIGALVSNLKAAQEQNVELVLEEVQPPVMIVLSMTGLTEMFQIQSSAEWTERQQLEPETHPSIRSRVKRLIDIVGAIAGLIITGIIFIPVAILIKLDSPGPILFQQTRCGWMGKRFQIWKFRSMCTNAEAIKAKIPNQASGAFFKNDNDPRITRVGRFLRRTSLDEFPQFWNVLQGDMSLVGTRPPTPDEVERYQVPQWQRLDVKPGMTGEWQVHGRSRVRDFEDVIKLDLRYQQNWSLKYDIYLIWKTIVIIFNKNSGAV
ncbi:anti-sigma factor antagonist [Pleurocapsales cyanobacterium LEGE 06147]|nr:anti-sigma factor antagonist [Pleurocapsales cyanobacterium LEGE 06147]